MPEYIMSANKKFETINNEELRAALKEWMVDVAKGMRPVQISATGVSNASQIVQLGGATSLTGGKLGPSEGFLWAVTRLSMRVDDKPAAFTIYHNHVSSQRVIRDVDGSQNGYATFGAQELLLNGGESLVMRAPSASVGASATVFGQAIEIPNQLLWKWLAG